VTCRAFDLQRKGTRLIPGLTQLLSKRPDLYSLGVWPGYYEKAKGVYVWDIDGTQYLDMSNAAIGAAVLGYADDAVDDAVVGAVRSGVVSSLNCPEEVALAEKLCQLHPWASMVRFARGGGEAMSIAVRIARAATGRDRVAFCGYHGWCDWYLATNLEGAHGLNEHLLPGLDPAGVPKALAGTALPFRYNRPEELAAIVKRHGPELAAVIMEPLRSALPAPGFIEEVRRLADSCGAVFVVDEVSAGFRFCTGGAHLRYFPVMPDMAVFAKAMGNGYAISAVIGRGEVMENAQKTFISSTNWTERIGPTAALATIARHEALDCYDRLAAMGVRIKQGWVEAGARHKLTVRADGMDPAPHFSIEHERFPELKAYFVQGMIDRGMLASNLCYLTAAHTDDHVAAYLAACDDVFGLLADALDRGDLDRRLRGAPSAVGFQRLA